MPTTVDQISNFLSDKNNKKFHYNDFEELDYKIPSGSLNLDLALGGGLPAGVHRFTGVNEGGKTSEALEVMKNFLKTVPNARGLYVKAEGRLSPDMQKRSGVEFTSSPEDWADGNCFVFAVRLRSDFDNIYAFLHPHCQSFLATGTLHH